MMHSLMLADGKKVLLVRSDNMFNVHWADRIFI